MFGGSSCGHRRLHELNTDLEAVGYISGKGFNRRIRFQTRPRENWSVTVYSDLNLTVAVFVCVWCLFEACGVLAPVYSIEMV